jgi:Zn-finger nucleic acid-binding protein
MKWINKGEIEKFVEHVRSKIGKESSSAKSPEKDIPSQIQKLSDLKEQGILTDEEFEKKKTELLSRL